MQRLWIYDCPWEKRCKVIHVIVPIIFSDVGERLSQCMWLFNYNSYGKIRHCACKGNLPMFLLIFILSSKGPLFFYENLQLKCKNTDTQYSSCGPTVDVSNVLKRNGFPNLLVIQHVRCGTQVGYVSKAALFRMLVETRISGWHSFYCLEFGVWHIFILKRIRWRLLRGMFEVFFSKNQFYDLTS